MRSSPAGSPLLPVLETSVFTLENGLEVLVHEDFSAPVVSVQAWVQTGSIHEGKWLGAGISHLLEHLLFKGTPKRSASQMAQHVQDVGGYINAYTSFDRTVYWLDMPAKGFAVGLEVLAEAVFESVIPPEEFAKEQEVIRREFAMGFDDADQVAGKKLFANAYRVHPYRHPVIGHLQPFNALSREDVLEYYRKRYVPNNVFFVVSGAVEAGVVREGLERWVGGRPRVALEPVWVPQEPLQLGRREVAEPFATELTRLQMGWHVPDVTHPDIPALHVLSSVLGQGRSSRLYRRLREREGLVHGIDAWTYTPAEPGLFGVDALLDPDKPERVLRAVEEELDRVCQEGVEERELEKVRRMAWSGHVGGLETARGRASDLGDNWLVSRNLDLSRLYFQKLLEVRPEDVQRVAQKYVFREGATVVRLHPKGEEGQGRAVVGAGRRGEMRRRVYANGLRSVVCEDHALPMVTMVAVFKAGLLVETPEQSGVTRLFARAWTKGTQRRSGEALAETLEALGGGIGADGGNHSVSVTVRVLRQDWKVGLEILSEVLREADFPESVIAREKEAQLAAIKAEEEEPVAVAGRLMRERLMEGHPYALPRSGTPESVAGIDRGMLLEYRDRYVVGRNGVLAVFGDVDGAEVEAEVERLLGEGLAAGEEALREPQVSPVLAREVVVEAELDKQQAVLFVGYRGVDLFSADRAALDLLDEACSDLGSRMFVRIREQLGLAYFVGSSQMVGLAPGVFAFYLGTDPMKRTAVLAELRDEIAQLAEGGLSEGELARAKEKYLGALEIRNQRMDALAVGCALDELYGLGAEHYRVVRERIRGVTLSEVREVARRIFGQQEAVVVCVGPKGTEHGG